MRSKSQSFIAHIVSHYDPWISASPVSLLRPRHGAGVALAQRTVAAPRAADVGADLDAGERRPGADLDNGGETAELPPQAAARGWTSLLLPDELGADLATQTELALLGRLYLAEYLEHLEQNVQKFHFSLRFSRHPTGHLISGQIGQGLLILLQGGGQQGHGLKWKSSVTNHDLEWRK